MEDKHVLVETVPATEMQARLLGLLYAIPHRVTRVTYRAQPVVAVIPWDIYCLLNGELAPHSEDSRYPTLEKVSMRITDVRGLFYSYSKRLAPLLDGVRGKVIEITRRGKYVGAVLAWKYCEHWLTENGMMDTASSGDAHPSHSATFTIATARHRLFTFAKQFADEQERGVHRPIPVENDGRPVFVIVPWEWYRLVTAFVKSQSPTQFQVSGDDTTCDLSTSMLRSTTQHEIEK